MFANPTSNVGWEKRTFLVDVESSQSFQKCSKAGTQTVRAEVFIKLGIFSRLGTFFSICWAFCYLSEQSVVGCLTKKNLHIIQQTSFFFRARRTCWNEYPNGPSRDVLNTSLVLFVCVWQTGDLIKALCPFIRRSSGCRTWQCANPACSLPYFNLYNPNFLNSFTKMYCYWVSCGCCMRLDFKVVFLETQLSSFNLSNLILLDQ